jgi:hypothetical protein
VVPGAGWTVRAATLRGLDHAQQGQPSQDAFGVAWSPARGSLLLAIADGLGSLPRSGTLARHAVRIGLDALRGGPTRGQRNVSEAIRHTATDTARYAVERGIDGATTLLLAELYPHPNGVEVHAASVGDGELWVATRTQWRPKLHDAKADRSTRVLTANAQPLLWAGLLRPGMVLLAATDGFAGALGDGDTPLATRLLSRWAGPPSQVEFLNHVSFFDGYSVDDRTVVTVWPDPFGGG